MGLIFDNRRISSFQLISFGFLSVILIGCFLLMLPWSSVSGRMTSFSDALFTSVSAVCVTGLVVHDTATYWSAFGQAVILLLIQTGGMGIVTIAVMISRVSGRKIGLRERSTMQTTIAAPQVGGIVRLTGFIFKIMLTIELAGALILMPVFCGDHGVPAGLWQSVFHSISAFCNAGFDLMGFKEPYSSLTSYSSDIAVNLTISALIVAGGLGFLTYDDIRKNRLRFRKYRLQSKIILTSTGILLLFGFLYFWFFEYEQEAGKERFLLSLFQSVSPRTAGFNTADLTELSDSGKVFMILLMLIGGSPGSTAGGMKTTTIAVLVLSSAAVFRRREFAHCFGRRISYSVIREAAAILLMYLCLFLGGGMIISGIEGLPLLTCLFETASAVGTVGLSLGITAELGIVSKSILMLLMFFGRVGGLTLIFAVVSPTRNRLSKLPQENITVG